MVALLIVPLVGALAVAGEVSSWYTVNRTLQNAADSAAIAAAWNADTTNDSGTPALAGYQREANAVAAQYGLVTGASNVTVTPITVTCPSGSGTCYQVTISKVVPVMLTGILGYAGDTTLAGGRAQTISAKAIASGQGGGASFCLLALGGTVDTGIQTAGTPKADMSGCSIGSNGDESCKGNGLGADSVYAYYSADANCTASGSPGSAHSNYATAFTDTLDAGRASNLPSDDCGGSYPQESGGIASNLLSSSYTGGGVQKFCGDVQLYDATPGKKGKINYSPSTVSLASGTVLVIFNGTLDIPSGASLGGSGVTVIFTGSKVAGLTPAYYPTGGGSLNISSPSSGDWKGVAVWQDPSLPKQTISDAGNSPTWNIGGMVYLPVSDLTLTGAVNKDGKGSCFGLVVNTIVIKGTGYIVDHNGCGTSGTTLPGIPGTVVALVQ